MLDHLVPSDLTAYRIIEEALTNATKYASDHAARVRLSYTASFLAITVTNDGTAATAAVPGGGYGLMGMHERANSIGASLRAGPRPEGGFEVSTALPIQPHTQAEVLRTTRGNPLTIRVLLADDQALLRGTFPDRRLVSEYVESGGNAAQGPIDG